MSFEPYVTREAHAVASLGDPDFDLYRPSAEHVLLRESVRALAGDKIAPRAAEIDETGEFPWDVYEALVQGDLHAIHVPEQYGGAGGDALAACIVIEEVARPATRGEASGGREEQLALLLLRLYLGQRPLDWRVASPGH